MLQPWSVLLAPVSPPSKDRCSKREQFHGKGRRCLLILEFLYPCNSRRLANRVKLSQTPTGLLNVSVSLASPMQGSGRTAPPACPLVEHESALCCHIVLQQVFITRLREQRYPTRAELDAAAPENPVMFRTGPDASLNVPLADNGGSALTMLPYQVITP